MTPAHFPEQNVVFAENQPEYLPLPAFRDDGPAGTVVTCWQLSLKERLRLLITGQLWLTMMTFHKPLTPVFLTTRKGDVLTTTDEP